MTELPEHVVRNRRAWDRWAQEYQEPGERAWARTEPVWGIWGVAESTLHVMPDQLEGLDTIELGCGTGYISAWLARRGARPVGIDNSEAQLATARRLQAQFGIEFPLIHGNAESMPFESERFDLAISEYGASLWCDAYRWIPEAARLLRPGGRLIFLTNSPLLMLCSSDQEDVPAGTTLVRPYFGMHRFEGPADESVEFHLGHGDMLAVLRESGFEVEALIEVQPPAGATTRFPLATLEWARQWPCEEIWKARKHGFPLPSGEGRGRGIEG